MRARPKSLLVLASLLLAGCAGDSRNTRPSPSRPRIWEPGLSAKGVIPMPTWIEHPPRMPGYHFFVGESIGSPAKDEALEKAWISAFVRIGMAEFPELAIVSSKSVENMRSASFERSLILKLEHVDWTGIREAADYGSPFVDYDTAERHYVVHRLLWWADADMAAARSKLRLAGIHRIPAPPETVRKDEKKLVDAVRAVKELNERLERRNRLHDRVFGELKCGVTIEDLYRILGAPDRSNPYNGMIVEKEYYWGQYKAERYADNPNIAAVGREDGIAKRRILCPGVIPRDGD